MFTIQRLRIYLSLQKGQLIKFGGRFCHGSSATIKTPLAAGYKPKDVESEILMPTPTGAPAAHREDQMTFRMILPPPNVTGYLHLGHALMSTIQDVICRRKRQEGYQVTWVPGTDHAGIATQVVVEKKLFKEKQQTRHQIGRTAFLEEVAKWKNEKENNITHELKRLGCSLDWEKEYFTMDEQRANAVTEAFIHFFDEGIIRRQNSLVNWSCVLESAISDIEVDNHEIIAPTGIRVPGYNKPIIFGEIHDISYKIKGTDRTIVVSTTRPETILGDVAIAVHPEDTRYTEFRETPTWVVHPFRNELLPIVFDESVDREFGTGAVKITPAHDKHDFELAKRHSLPSVQVFTEKGTVVERFQQFSNEPRFIARANIIKALKTVGLYNGARPHKMQLPICSRSNDVIEYMLRPQWFIDCKIMAQQAITAVETGQIRLHPENFTSDWFRWLKDCKEWCISRQIWWGHRIPAYLCKVDENSTWVAARSKDEAASKAAGILKLDKKRIEVSQDKDVLDTWFSASLLPLSAYGWPNKKCTSLNLMETGHDILFFWVARMVMMGMKLTGKVPFTDVLLNGIVCDVHGRKMSKSLGNVILPDQVIYGSTLEQLSSEIQKAYSIGTLSKGEMEKSLRGVQQTFPNGIPECGTDALRFTLCSYNIKSHYINFDVSECHTNKLFFNKIWQATRYTISAFEKLDISMNGVNIQEVQLTDFDRWILSRLSDTQRICDEGFEKYNFHFAVNALKTFFYKNFCDVYLETTKLNIGKGNESAISHCVVLSTCLSLGLQLMSPFTPFLSQKLLKYLPNIGNFSCDQYSDKALELEIEDVLDICAAIRQFKSQNKIARKHEPIIHLFPKSPEAFKLVERFKDHIQTLCLANGIVINSTTSEKREKDFNLVSTASHLCSFAIFTNQILQKNDKVDAVNTKKLAKLQSNLQKLLKTISSDGYQKSASKEIQRKHLEKIKEIESEINSISDLK
ncbi:unnamed protein product [Hermetia illucens]|uniref:valine--tRNA ligase n=1 Tax=Hermetia illucens TaxID=343691 RepID=A0A7R8UJH4_HERIL|nr:valine--tRNA ligase isoform X2 [Hermetia illucens]CAD7082003.1 unnamed protein product [Hermetia illucens]